MGGYCSPAYVSIGNVPYSSDKWVKFFVIILSSIDFAGKGVNSMWFFYFFIISVPVLLLIDL